MATPTNKELAIKVIKEEFSGISQSGIDALLANIEIETGFNKFVEIPQDYDDVMNNPDLVSMQANLNSFKGGKKKYDKLSDQEKLGVLYQGDKKAKYAGGIGGLQLTAANYGGLGGFEAELDSIAQTLNMSSEDLYNEAKTSPEMAIRLSMIHLRDIKNVGTQELNVTDGQSLRKDYINPGETQGVATSAQQSRTAIFQSYTPKVAGVSQDIKQPENKLSKNEQEVIDLQTSKRNNINISNAFTEPSDEEKEKLKRSVISIGSQIQSDVDAGTLKGDDDAILKEFMKRIQKEAGFEGIDITNAEEVGKARGIIDFVTKTANEDLGESIRGGVFDSKIEDVFEDNANNAKNNLLSLGIPSKGTYLIEEKTPLDILRQEGIEGGKVIRPVGITEKLETKNNILQLINDDPDLNSKMVSSGLTPEEFADTLVDGVESADKASNSATQEEKEEAVTRHETRLADAISEYTPEEVVEEVVEDTTEVDAVNELKDKRSRQMAMAEKALTGLKAAAGLTSLSKALQEPDIKTPQVSSLMLEALGKQKKLSTMGLNAAEKASAMQGINEAYSGAIKNVLGASGGQRGSFLANQGVADANRVKGLLQLSAQDAAVRRQNVGQYNQLASSVGQMQLSADMSAEQMKQQAIAQNKQMLGGIGTNLLSDAISDATYYLNPNREHMDEMMKQYMESTTSNNSYTPPTETDVIGTNNPSMTDKERKAEVARLALEKKNNTI